MDDPPNEDGEYLVFAYSKEFNRMVQIPVNYDKEMDDWYYSLNGIGLGCEVKHWMQLPLPPTDAEKEGE